MAASPSTPKIGVYVLSEFAFCPRAGLVAFEQDREDMGEAPGPTPRLGYLPDYSVQLIEEGINQSWNRIWGVLTLSPIVGLVLFWTYLFGNPEAAIILAVVLAGWLLVWLVKQLKNVAELKKKLDAAQAAAPKKPDPNLAVSQSVHWWSLLKAGFAFRDYVKPHDDREWNLIGHPWGVLESGATRIPVFRKLDGKEELHHQHTVRMAAYCRLMEACQGGRAPYAIILFGDGYDGVTIPNTNANRATFEQALAQARRVLASVESDQLVPEQPANLTICSGCHVGEPRVYREGESETVLRGETWIPMTKAGVDGRSYHSRCGDRFHWVPPHNQAKELKLC